MSLSSAAMILIAATILSGCELSERAEEPRGSGQIERTDLWPFWPTDMRIHPLTRLANDPEADESTLELRLEFTDPHGHTTRAVGMATVELYEPLAGTEARGVWNHDLADMDANTRHFDAVTQTYLLRLRIDPDELPSRVQLQVRFLGENDSLLEARRDVQLRNNR